MIYDGLYDGLYNGWLYNELYDGLYNGWYEGLMVGCIKKGMRWVVHRVVSKVLYYMHVPPSPVLDVFNTPAQCYIINNKIK